MPLPPFITEGVVIVLASKIHREINKGDPLPFLSIALSLLDFTNQAGLHHTPCEVCLHSKLSALAKSTSRSSFTNLANDHKNCDFDGEKRVLGELSKSSCTGNGFPVKWTLEILEAI